jgi:hypothetical protein
MPRPEAELSNIAKANILAPYLPQRRQTPEEKDRVITAREQAVKAFKRKHGRLPKTTAEHGAVSLTAATRARG